MSNINKMEKKLSAAQLKEDLLNGLTRYKKDDIGFGSLEKKYNLSDTEMAMILTHPKLKDVQSAIPNFIIIDDIEEEEDQKERVEEFTTSQGLEKATLPYFSSAPEKTTKVATSTVNVVMGSLPKVERKAEYKPFI